MRSSLLLALLALASCDASSVDDPSAAEPLADGKADGLSAAAAEASKLLLYEVQVRAANACREDLGSSAQRAACSAKVAPDVEYRAEGMSCAELDDLEDIRLGTLDDLVEPTNDFRQGITLAYIHDTLHANTVWLMPLFPNNDRWSIPDACDNLGSPYAVRDYFHVSASLSRACIVKGLDEESSDDEGGPCDGTAALDTVIAAAHARGLRVFLDVAFNHFGHNYDFYDTVDHVPVRQRIAKGEDLDKLWRFDKTWEAATLHPRVLDSEAALDDLAMRDALAKKDLASLDARCPDLAGRARVRAFTMWRDALDWERERFPCEPSYLEAALPGFYLGKNHWDPARAAGDTFTNDWRDVKFLFHHEDNQAHQHELVREREYLFRVLNYWASRGIDGFRLDHTTDPDGGMAPNEWRYILGKVAYAATKRGQARPLFLAEEFGDQQGMADVVDMLTEGYVFDITGRNGQTKDARYVERTLSNTERFGDRALVLAALETHDEKRLTDGTGFDPWTGAGFWGLGLTTWSAPMILMGQELGEPYGLGFRKSDLLRSRFEGSPNAFAEADQLAAFYGEMMRVRLDPKNRALLSKDHAFLRARDSGQADARLYAAVKWSSDKNVVFVFHNLWRDNAAQSYFIPDDLAKTLAIKDTLAYRLVDVFTEQQVGACRSGADLKWDLYVALDRDTRLQWLRLELCPPQ